MVDLQDRYRGVLLGLACGDALGGPVEFKSRDEIVELYPEGLRDFVGGGWLSLTPGEITDDTQMTLAIARSLVEHPSLDMNDVAARFLEWFHSDPKDVGLTTRSALQALDKGISWEEAGEHVNGYAAGNAAGNGAIMRCAPIALRFRSDHSMLEQASRDSARITHADVRCQWAAVAINRLIVRLLNGITTNNLVESTLKTIDDPETREALKKATLLERDQVRSGGFVLDTMQAAVWSLLHHTDLESTIIEAVSLGADTDTTAAVAGAMAGARYGAEAIPERWAANVQYRDELIELADRLFALSQG
ncbi:MAG: ADP-ribosylglycohydrolase family protein [Thermomicrobiales bacterium]